MLSRFLVVIVLILFGVSCSKNADPVPPVQPCLVKKISTHYTSTGFTSDLIETFEYNASFQLIKNTRNETTTTSSPSTGVLNYTYTNGAISKVSYGTSTSNWTVQNGRLVKTVIVGSYGTGTVDMVYFADGKLFSYHYGSNPDNVELGNSLTYSSNGNLAKDEYFINIKSPTGTSSTAATSTYLTFDSKTNPYSLLARAKGISCYFLFVDGQYWPDGLSKNNALSYTLLTRDLNSGTESTVTVNYTYEYNGKGYVTKSVRTDPYSVRTTTFEYTNCD